MLARHFGRPRGLLGRLVGRLMARFNGDFNRWVVEELGQECKGPTRTHRGDQLGRLSVREEEMAATYMKRNSDIQTVFIRQVEGVPILGDVKMKPLIAGDHMTLLELKYAPEARSELHVHQHEALCYVVEGSVRVTVGQEEFVLEAGDVCVHPKGVPHRICGVVQATVIEIKSPVQPISQFLRTSNA
jgi:quercetin dioxygenase-like cupin family protein